MPKKIYITVDDEDFNYREFIQNNLLGTICHTTASTSSYEKILKEGKIKHSQDGITQSYRNSFGFNNNCVCMFDFRNIEHNVVFLRNAITCFYPYYIFILKQEEYTNLIPPKDYEEINSNPKTGYGVPYYECWYKGDLSLDKIEKIIIVKHKKRNQFLDRVV